MKDYTDLYYDHDKRELYKVVNGQRESLSVDEAKAYLLSNDFRDCNMAFHTLASHDFDMESVEQYYREMDSY